MSVADDIRTQPVKEDQVAIWWLGQNSYVLKNAAGRLLMIDAYFSRAKAPEFYVHDCPPIGAEDVAIDYAFCTHAHYDHTDPDFLVPLSQRSEQTVFLCPEDAAPMLQEAGMAKERIQIVQCGEQIPLDGVVVHVVRSKTPAVENCLHYGYILDFGCCKVWNTGDIMRDASREPKLMEPVAALRPDVAMITCSPTEEEFPSFEEAAEIARLVGARVAVPSHYDCFAKRTWDPAGFAAAFGDSPPSPVVIPYCGVYVLGST